MKDTRGLKEKWLSVACIFEKEITIRHTDLHIGLQREISIICM